FLIWIIFFAVFLYTLNLGVIFFSSALVKIKPKQEFINLDTNLTASHNPQAGELGFKKVQIEKEESLSMIATGVSENGQKASGTIIIYNTYSSTDQLLVKNTRFETPDNKIFRINEKVVVPGNSSLETAVYADEPGEKYNIGLVDFTIPGFKGDPRYEKIYARSKTSMTGGSSSATNFLTEEDVVKAEEQLKEKFQNYFAESITKEKLEEYIFFIDSIVINYDESVKDGLVLKQKAVATAFLFRQTDLNREIIKNYLTTELLDKVNVYNLENLNFDLINYDKDKDKLFFNLNGKTHLVWIFDKDQLIKDLAGADYKDYNFVFQRYPATESSEIIFSPSWWHKMPKKPSKIKVEEILLTGQD
ncbi:baseplate J/gp47 family protein, partial [Patescibacteria group bacterium]|nr:baseplate J/gp47 family protein [Patescibacteria group bacterium]